MRRRGFAIVMCLLLITLLLVLGMAFLSQRSAQAEAAVRTRYAIQARALAMQGLEDARVKAGNIYSFPPGPPDSQPYYCYSEDVFSWDGSSVVGSYTVTTDLTMVLLPYRILKITSIGILGKRTSPTAVYKLRAELDHSVADRLDPTKDNANLFQWTYFKDFGGL